MVAEVSEGRVRACARNGCEVGAFFFCVFFFPPFLFEVARICYLAIPPLLRCGEAFLRTPLRLMFAYTTFASCTSCCPLCSLATHSFFLPFVFPSFFFPSHVLFFCLCLLGGARQ
jgi:hypothetical protein